VGSPPEHAPPSLSLHLTYFIFICLFLTCLSHQKIHQSRLIFVHSYFPSN
jgi:hypothetical protein